MLFLGGKMRPIGFNIKNNSAYLHQYKLSEIAKEYQTPLYILDEIQLKKNFEDYQQYFKGKTFQSTIVYASKALLTPYICDLTKEYDFYMDSVSLGDLFVAKTSNFPMENIVLHGNNKSIEELEYALKNKVGYIVVDNLYELENLDYLVNQLKIASKILIRINPGIDAHTHKYIQTANHASKFGINIEDIKTIHQMIKIVKSSKYLNLCGFHSHIGSQIQQVEPFIAEIEKMSIFQNEIAKKYKLHLPLLNIGGGFGIKYTIEDQTLSIKEMMSLISHQIDKTLSKQKMINHIMIEPGRSIVGNAGITLYTCNQIKHTLNKNYLLIDGGMTDNIRPALYNAKYECDIVDKMNQKKEITVDIVGKACESGDIIRENVNIPNINHNDVLVVYATGAYNYSMASEYNNHLKPALIVIGDKIKVISRRENLEDLNRFFK